MRTINRQFTKFQIIANRVQTPEDSGVNDDLKKDLDYRTGKLKDDLNLTYNFISENESVLKIFVIPEGYFKPGETCYYTNNEKKDFEDFLKKLSTEKKSNKQDKNSTKQDKDSEKVDNSEPYKWTDWLIVFGTFEYQFKDKRMRPNTGETSESYQYRKTVYYLINNELFSITNFYGKTRASSELSNVRNFKSRKLRNAYFNIGKKTIGIEMDDDHLNAQSKNSLLKGGYLYYNRIKGLDIQIVLTSGTSYYWWLNAVKNGKYFFQLDGYWKTTDCYKIIKQQTIPVYNKSFDKSKLKKIPKPEMYKQMFQNVTVELINKKEKGLVQNKIEFYNSGQKSQVRISDEQKL